MKNKEIENIKLSTDLEIKNLKAEIETLQN